MIAAPEPSLRRRLRLPACIDILAFGCLLKEGDAYMDSKVAGVLIRAERIKRNWSQEGLCRGICAMSYLSKIEQGKAEASEEIIRALFARLELPWYGAEELPDAAATIERLYDMLLSGDVEGFSAERDSFMPLAGKLKHSAFAADAALLSELMAKRSKSVDAELEPCLSIRQLAFQRMLQARYDEAIRLCPAAFFYYCAGADAYEKGANYSAAMEYLRRGYELAAQDGAPHLMLLCRMIMGNCYSNLLEVEEMDREYSAAVRLARALRRDSDLRAMEYNSACTRLETGKYREAYAYFSSLDCPGMMDLHKKAVCCEKLGLYDEARSALDAADAMESEWPDTSAAREMCALVRFRLDNADYLHLQEYGDALLRVFERCRAQLPVGYAGFHLPWVLEWYTASRQYRRAYELVREFPLKSKII